MRSVAFIHPGTPEMASFRYRTLIPAQQLNAKVNEGGVETLVVSKPDPHIYQQCVLAKNIGIKIVADFCDDHFNHPELGETYRRFARLADHIVTPTAKMRDRLMEDREYGGIFNSHAHRYTTFSVIADPYEFEEVAPHADGERLIWFGHNAGLKALYCHPPNLTIVTGPRIDPGMVLYSPESLKEEMLKANIAIFPTAKGHEYKSPNRLINALRMGLFPVCDPHPSYDEFKKFIWSTEFPTGVKWAREFKHELNDFVKQGQDYIRDKFSPEAIGNQWRELLESL